MIERSFTVAVSVDRAFAAWTKHIDMWWPPNHRPNGTSGVIVLEPQIGGRFTDRGADGRVVELGVVTSWEPPHRLAYRFFMGSGAEHPSDVLIAFAQDGDGTRVDIRHEQGAVSDERWGATNGGYIVAWDHLIDVFPSFAEQSA